MFHYTLPHGHFMTTTKITEKGITFDPALYEQRYCATIQILEDLRWVEKIKKVTEFGCAQMRLFQLMRRIETIENILQVDIDIDILKNHLQEIKPLISDYLRQRQAPLHVEVLHGSVADSAEELRNTDAVIALELIEHVNDDVLAKIPVNIFGFMQPKIVIFSTPNSEFNEIFTRFRPLLPNGFRHHDHKFEWTREQFKSWCLRITEDYTNYMFSMLGVGEPPSADQALGHASQIALFVRKDMLDLPLVDALQPQPVANNSDAYKTVSVVDFPFNVDTRTPEQKLWEAIEMHLYNCTKYEDNYDYKKYAYKLSLSVLTERVSYLDATRETVIKLLQKQQKLIEDDFVVIPEQYDESSESVDSYDQADLTMAEEEHT